MFGYIYVTSVVEIRKMYAMFFTAATLLPNLSVKQLPLLSVC